jgi:hypothetical protein
VQIATASSPVGSGVFSIKGLEGAHIAGRAAKVVWKSEHHLALGVQATRRAVHTHDWADKRISRCKRSKLVAYYYGVAHGHALTRKTPPNLFLLGPIGHAQREPC